MRSYPNHYRVGALSFCRYCLEVSQKGCTFVFGYTLFEYESATETHSCHHYGA